MDDDQAQGSTEKDQLSTSPSTSDNENSVGEESSEASTANGVSNSGTSYSFGSSLEEDMLHIFGPEHSFAPSPSSLKTYKVVGDNLDKNVKPTDYRVDSQTKSLHFFQSYAVRDRIDLSSYDDSPPVVDESSIDTTKLLPSASDSEEQTKHFAYHVARVLKQYMPFLTSYGSGLETHIRHQFYEEMSQKSEIVSLDTCMYMQPLMIPNFI